jgi:hypothetical protein
MSSVSTENPIDFNSIKWGSFTKQFKAYKSDHPSSKVKDLAQFADFVLKNHKKFQPITLKRARFYVNVLARKDSAGMVGGKLAVKDIKNLIDASYVKGNKNIDGFDIDNELSDNYVKVFKKKDDPSHAVVVHRGSADFTDWYLDSKIARGKSIEDSSRYKHSLDIQKRAEQKYGANNVSTVGHSLGSFLSSNVGKNSKEIINLNRPVVPTTKVHPETPANEYHIRSTRDVVSGTQNIRPKEEKEIVVKAETWNPLTEHSTKILDRLDPNQMIGEGQPCLKKLSVKELKAMLKSMPKKGGVRLTGMKKKELRSACGACRCSCCMKGGADARQKGDASEMRQYIFEEGHKLKKEGKPFKQYSPILDLADELNAIVHSNDPEQTNKKGDKTRRFNQYYDATNQYDPTAEPVIVKAKPIYEPLHAPREAEYLLDKEEIDYIIAHADWEKRFKEAVAYNHFVNKQKVYLDTFLKRKALWDKSTPLQRKQNHLVNPKPDPQADIKFSPEKFPLQNIDAIKAQEPKKPTGSGLSGGETVYSNYTLDGSYRPPPKKKDDSYQVWNNYYQGLKSSGLLNGMGMEGGESLGFFGNIKRAFETSWNKKPTEQEKPILRGIFGAEKGLTDYVLKPLAPPVGQIAEAQRRLLEDKYMT